jgi:pimeloyl-ACP methyl ester carboxylesterase
LKTLAIGDTEVQYDVHGVGEPIILLHANPFVDWYLPLIERMPNYSIVRYTRRSASNAPLSVARDAATCARLAEHLGWRRAHIVGHSAGALAALQLAVDSPALVRTLSLLEPAVTSPASDTPPVAGADPFAPILRAFTAGDHHSAIELFLVLVGGDQARAALDNAVPEAFQHAVDACDYFFRVEMPANMQYSFTAELAARINTPVLNVVGACTKPGFVSGADTVQSWFPHAERFTLPQATHLLMVEQPDAMATELDRFFNSHTTD